MTSDDIIRGCREGDSVTQHRLFDCYAARVHQIAARLVGGADAEDLVQQIFLKVFTAIDRFAGNSSFDTWLFRVAVNECLQHLRKKARQPAACELCDADLATQGEAGAIVDREFLAHALDRLDLDHRSVFLLRETEGLSYREISQTLGISEGTVASRLNRARRELRSALVALGWEA